MIGNGWTDKVEPVKWLHEFSLSSLVSFSHSQTSGSLLLVVSLWMVVGKKKSNFFFFFTVIQIVCILIVFAEEQLQLYFNLLINYTDILLMFHASVWSAAVLLMPLIRFIYLWHFFTDWAQYKYLELLSNIPLHGVLETWLTAIKFLLQN